jgi:radical SAM protein (TIGR01212 family)
MDEPFHSFSEFLQSKFPGCKVLKIPINAGLSCPNRDGTLSAAGCIFCDRYAAGPIRTASWPIDRQIESYMQHHPGVKYIAYFQSHCNTYGPVPELRRKYEIALRYRDIVGLSIGTRPDAIPEPVFSLLEEMSRRIYLSVELGLQSIHEESLLLLNRNHSYPQFLQAFHELKRRGIDVVVHLIIGIPGETRPHMLATIAAMNRLKPAGVKLHLLHVLKDTELHSRYVRAPFPLLDQDEYTDIIVDLLEHLDPQIVIHRLLADREKDIFVAPLWALNKAAVLNSIRAKMRARGSRQGSGLRQDDPLAGKPWTAKRALPLTKKIKCCRSSIVKEN